MILGGGGYSNDVLKSIDASLRKKKTLFKKTQLFRMLFKFAISLRKVNKKISIKLIIIIYHINNENCSSKMVFMNSSV